MTDRWEYTQEKIELDERQAHEDFLCEGLPFCVHCLDDRDLEEMIEHVNKELERQMEKKLYYLGDSVYAEFDGYGINLTTNNGYADDPRNTIYMEPSVLDRLHSFVESIKHSDKE